MKNKELKRLLKSDSVTIDQTAKNNALAHSLNAAAHRTGAIDFIGFIKNQVYYLTPAYVIFCAVYTLFVPFAALMFSDVNTVLIIGILTPFLAALSVPNILGSIDGNMLELESSCLYRPNSVFSARMIICSGIDILAVLITSAVSSAFAGNFGYIMLLELALLSASMLLCLVLSLCVKNQYTPVISASIVTFGVAALVARVKSLYLTPTFHSLRSYVGSQLLLAMCAVMIGGLIITTAVLSKKYLYSGGFSNDN